MEKANVEKYIKNCPICTKRKHDLSRKKNTLTIATAKNIFPETRYKFRYWVTGITKPNDGGILRYDLHNNRRIYKIRKIYPMQNNNNSRKASKAVLEK